MGNLLGSLSSLSATNTKSKEALVLAWVSGEKLFYRVLTSPHSQYSMWWPYQSKILVRQREGPSWPSGDSFLVIGSIQKFLNALVKKLKSNWLAGQSAYQRSHHAGAKSPCGQKQPRNSQPDLQGYTAPAESNERPTRPLPNWEWSQVSSSRCQLSKC